jgi:hypothetical protein
MPELEDGQLSIQEASTNARLATNLIFKLLAGLKDIGKLSDDELTHIAKSLIVELPSDHERFATWGLLERLLPDFKRPDADKP